MCIYLSIYIYIMRNLFSFSSNSLLMDHRTKRQYMFLSWICRKSNFLQKYKQHQGLVVAIKMHNSVLLSWGILLTESPAAAPRNPILY